MKDCNGRLYNQHVKLECLVNEIHLIVPFFFLLNLVNIKHKKDVSL